MRDVGFEWVIGEERIAWRDVLAETLAHRTHHTRQRRDVQRRDDVFADHFPARVEQQTARVVRLADDRRVAGPKDVVLHLLDDPGKPAHDDLKGNGVDGSGRHRAQL